MAQQFEQPLETGDNLRTQRMTADESRAVIALWQQEQTELTGLTDKPAVPDVAEGLDITLEDVQRLLSEVRAQRLEATRALATEQELIEIRLAEEARQLAEIQRQRAELRREQAEVERRYPEGERRQLSQGIYPESEQAAQSFTTMVVVAICLLIWLLIMFIAANR